MAKKRLEDWRDIYDTPEKELAPMAADFAEHCERRARGGIGNFFWRMRHGRELAELAQFYASAYETATADHDKLVGKARKTVGMLCSMLGGSYSFPGEGKDKDGKGKAKDD